MITPNEFAEFVKTVGKRLKCETSEYDNEKGIHLEIRHPEHDFRNMAGITSLITANYSDLADMLYLTAESNRTTISPEMYGRIRKLAREYQFKLKPDKVKAALAYADGIDQPVTPPFSPAGSQP